MCKKPDEGDYLNVHAFHNDFRLTIKNCMTFNPPGTAIQCASLEMDRILKGKWLPPSAFYRGKLGRGQRGRAHCFFPSVAIAMMELQIETTKGKGGTGSDTERNISAMSFEQKKEYSTRIESLDGDELKKVIQIIYEGVSSSL
ncbi:hypothetical protein FRC06_006550 [Ceratobasidium sp. 370]|nr:hypothetical protein FRC06_006550 [Ceratobasidium sp. 370]